MILTKETTSSQHILALLIPKVVFRETKQVVLSSRDCAFWSTNLFERGEDLLLEFTKFGAEVMPFTKAFRTSYLFSTTNCVAENLLLREPFPKPIFVSVQREQELSSSDQIIAPLATVWTILWKIWQKHDLFTVVNIWLLFVIGNFDLESTFEDIVQTQETLSPQLLTETIEESLSSSANSNRY